SGSAVSTRSVTLTPALWRGAVGVGLAISLRLPIACDTILPPSRPLSSTHPRRRSSPRFAPPLAFPRRRSTVCCGSVAVARRSVGAPDWDAPLDGGFAKLRGGRWNPAGSFPVVYLCRSLAVALANVARGLAGQPFGPEDLDPAGGPVLVTARVTDDRFADIVT